MISTIVFVSLCFGIPIVSTLRSIYKDARLSENPQNMALMYTDTYEDTSVKKRPVGTWKQRDGKLIELNEMTDIHLANAIRLLVRNASNKFSTKVIEKSTGYQELYKEARKRGFKVNILESPITLNGKTEFAEIMIPTPRSKIAAGFFPTEWDSRLDEQI